MNDLVSYQLDVNETGNAIASITMDDGKVNSMSPTMIAAIQAALDKAESDAAIVVISGREGKFSAGFDLRIMQEGPEAAKAMVKAGALLAERLVNFPFPVVIACNGHALAMGAFLLLSADYRIGTAGNFKLGLNETAIGMVMPAFGCEIARYSLTPQYYKRCLVTAELFDPVASLEPGFLDEVVEAQQLLERAKEKALELAGLDMAAFKATKLGARQAARDALREAIKNDYED